MTTGTSIIQTGIWTLLGRALKLPGLSGPSLPALQRTDDNTCCGEMLRGFTIIRLWLSPESGPQSVARKSV